MPRKATAKSKPPEPQPTPASGISKKIIILAAAVLLAGALFYFKNVFLVASVNGEIIDRLSLIREMDKQTGKRTLQSLVSKALILQEAKKQNASVSQKEIDEEIKKIEQSFEGSGQKLDTVLASQNLTKADLVEQVTMQKLIEKMLAKDIKVSDKEISESMSQAGGEVTEATEQAKLKDSIQEQLRQQKLSEKFQSWITDLQSKAKITYF